MLTASEAKQLTMKNIENVSLEELEMIIELINEAIENGKYEINGDKKLNIQTIEKLKNLGYRAKNGFIMNEPYWNINWR